MGDFFVFAYLFLNRLFSRKHELGQENKHVVTGVFTILEFFALAIFFHLAFNSDAK